PGSTPSREGVTGCAPSLATPLRGQPLFATRSTLQATNLVISAAALAAPGAAAFPSSSASALRRTRSTRVSPGTVERFARGPVTRRQAARVVVSLELGRRLASITDDREPIRDPEVLAHRLIARYSHHVQERVGAIYLDSRNRVLREREIYVGTHNSAMVSTRD